MTFNFICNKCGDAATYWLKIDKQRGDRNKCYVLCKGCMLIKLDSISTSDVYTLKKCNVSHTPVCGLCHNKITDKYTDYYACRVHTACLAKHIKEHIGARLWLKRWGGAKNKDGTQVYSYVLATEKSMHKYMTQSCRNPSAHETCRTIDAGQLLDGNYGFQWGGISSLEPEPDAVDHISYALSANLPTHMFEAEMPI